MARIQDIFSDFEQKKLDKEIAILQRIGENFVKSARLKGEYVDRTGNLRSSIGYIIVNDGKILHEDFHRTKGGDEGVAAAKEYVNEIASKYKGLTLIGFAGMDYAAAVEAKNYDVITGSAPTRKALSEQFDKFLNW